MKYNYRPFRQPRAACLRAGKLINISPVARQAFVDVPMAITPQLWRMIAGADTVSRRGSSSTKSLLDDPFDGGHERRDPTGIPPLPAYLMDLRCGRGPQSRGEIGDPPWR